MDGLAADGWRWMVLLLEMRIWDDADDGDGDGDGDSDDDGAVEEDPYNL